MDDHTAIPRDIDPPGHTTLPLILSVIALLLELSIVTSYLVFVL